MTLDDFKDHCAVFVLDRQPDGCNGYHVHVPDSGNIDVELDFRTALQTNISICFYAFHDKILTFKRDVELAIPQVEVIDPTHIL